MKYLATLVALTAHSAVAEPVFTDRSDRLPHHVYGGGWEHFVGGGLAVFDCNGDALPDIFAAGGENPAQMIRNTGHFTFAATDIPEVRGVTGAYPIDINADGFMDLFVLRVGDNRVLTGGPDCQFTDATDTLGIPHSDSWSTAFTAWWEGADNRPTLAIGNYVDRADPDGPFEACDDNAILRPVPQGYTSHALKPGFCPLSILAANDARGRPTLRLSNDRHYYVSGGHEQMWDIAERRFLGVADGWNNVSLWGMGIASRDLNGDGLDEVMLTSMGDQVLQFADADGVYTAADFAVGTYSQRPHVGGDGRPSTGWHAEFGDVDNDGRPDLFIAKGNVDQMPGMATRDPNNLLMQNPDGTFTETAHAAGVATFERARGAAFADFDLDGRLDLVVSNRRAPLELYRNETEGTRNWLRVSLRQAGGNRDAVGATIRVETPSMSQTMQNTIGGGHAGGQLLPRHFGLGNDAVAIVHVTWPDGTTSTHEAVAGESVTLHKP
ncbi:CRTAC1 family protein [Litoreibacter albidus]|uniref:Repeat domain-containing protein n=1 Tax=Litoreibacter albidus TaxID=670155 RepID=A0A1H2ZKD5_9RHOB|nr:CRTAC1 family protein [Litoreibacter albidus]SDX17159.1 Repeat domain-containing protein [Litoreibacter albidus]